MKQIDLIRELAKFKPTDEIVIFDDGKEKEIKEITRAKTDNTRFLQHKALLTTTL